MGWHEPYKDRHGFEITLFDSGGPTAQMQFFVKGPDGKNYGGWWRSEDTLQRRLSVAFFLVKLSLCLGIGRVVIAPVARLV